jgi:hypothetical protein
MSRPSWGDDAYRRPDLMQEKTPGEKKPDIDVPETGKEGGGVGKKGGDMGDKGKIGDEDLEKKEP